MSRDAIPLFNTEPSIFAVFRCWANRQNAFFSWSMPGNLAEMQYQFISPTKIHTLAQTCAIILSENICIWGDCVGSCDSSLSNILHNASSSRSTSSLSSFACFPFWNIVVRFSHFFFLSSMFAPDFRCLYFDCEQKICVKSCQPYRCQFHQWGEWEKNRDNWTTEPISCHTLCRCVKNCTKRKIVKNYGRNLSGQRWDRIMLKIAFYFHEKADTGNATGSSDRHWWYDAKRCLRTQAQPMPTQAHTFSR